MIIVTGGRSLVGQELVAMLMASGENFRLGTRDREASRDYFGQNLACATMDFDSPATVKTALNAGSRLFLSGGLGRSMFKRYRDAIRVAVSVEISHVVLLSCSDVLITDRAPNNLGKAFWAIEEELIQSGLDFTILRPAYIMQAMFQDAFVDLAEKRQLRALDPQAELSLGVVDSHDVAGVAYQVLNSPGHRNKTYSLMSQEITFAQMAEEFSNHLGSAVDVLYSPRRGRAGSPKEKIQQEMNASFLKAWQKGVRPVPNHTIESIIGEDPRSFRRFVQHYADYFSA